MSSNFPKNDQELFNVVAEHLLTQGEPAIEYDSKRTNCKYLTKDGKMCAIGCLIQKWYQPGFEGRTIKELLYNSSDVPLEMKNAFANFSTKLLSELQRIHDENSWENLKSIEIKLKSCATIFHLDYSVIGD